MAVTVRFFGVVSDLARRKEQQLDLEPGTTVAGLLVRLRAGNPAFAPVETQVRAVINGENASRETVVNDGDEVLLLLAIGGGA